MKPINLLHLGIASDHAGYQLKEALKAYLEEKPEIQLIKHSNYIDLIMPLIRIYFRPH